MSARSKRPTSKPRGVRLPDDLVDAVQRVADERGTTWSSASSELLREAVRIREVPGVTFVDGPTGRRAVVGGTGIDVWQVIDAWNSVDRDEAATQASFPSLTPMQIRSALAYYGRFPEEIDDRIAREESWTPERIRAEKPYLTPKPPRTES